MMSPDSSDLHNDSSLLSRVQQGSKYAFNILFEKYWETTFTHAHKRLKDEDQAKDIVQEIFTYIWMNKEILQINNLPAYLNTAVRNRVIKIVARKKHTSPFFDLLENMPGKSLHADGDLLWKEFYSSYEALLNTLPPQRQIIFRLRYQDDLPTKDIATLLGLSKKTVQNQIGKALEKLRTTLLHLWLIGLILFW